MCIRDSSEGDEPLEARFVSAPRHLEADVETDRANGRLVACLLYTSDAADERSSVDLGGRRIIKKKKSNDNTTEP